MDTDMTKGSPYAHLIKFSIPVLLGTLCQLLYNTVDTMVVGKFVGVGALAALGATGSFSYLIIGFGNGLSMGMGIIISQRYGAKDEEGLRKTFAMSMLCSLLSVIFLTVFGLLFAETMLRMIHTPEDILMDARDYLMTLYAGLIAVIFYNLFSTVLRAIGDSKSPLYFLIIASVLNIVLDIFCVTVLGMGVVSVGIATVVSQMISAVLCIFYMKRKYPFLNPSKEDWKLDLHLCRKLFEMGIPSALMNSLAAIGCIFMQYPLNRLGTSYIAGFSLGNRVEGYLSAMFPVRGNAVATYTGQNYGAKDYDRIKKGFMAATVISLVCVVISTVLGFTCMREAASIFMSKDTTDPLVLDTAVLYLHTVSWAWLFAASVWIFRTGCQGLGAANVPFWSSIAELVMRCVLCLILPGMLGAVGIVLAGVATWVAAGTVCPIFWYHRMKKVKAEIENASAVAA